MRFSFVFLFILFFSGFSFSQQRAGIYDIDFFIDRQLTTPLQINSVNGSVQSPVRNNLWLTDADIDSLKQLIVNSVSLQMNAITECIYRKTKKGKNIVTRNNGTIVRGMPIGNKKRSIREFEKDIYVKVRVNYTAYLTPSLSGMAFGIRKYRPNVYIYIKGFNSSRQRVFSKSIVVRDFEKLRSFQANVGGISIQNSEVLQPMQIREMLAKTLKEMEQKPNR